MFNTAAAILNFRKKCLVSWRCGTYSRVVRIRRLFKSIVPERQSILIVQFHLLHEKFFMACWPDTNLRFGFHNSLVNTFRKVFNKSSLDVDPDCYWKFTRSNTGCTLSGYSVFLLFYGNTRISAASELRRLLEGGALLAFPLHVRRLIEGGP